ncbi:MAG: tyrosine--tRNA ligase [Caldisericum sp.]|uniref:tyrosine--tRNA ligase n=1 Tax=Caldisericum TaxID=693074 RepID=UPI003C739D7E
MDAFEKIKRKTVEIINEDELKERLSSGKKLRVKLGADPTAPDLHLGHYVVLRKLRDFQELGHQVVFIIGDFTGLVGDPSGRSKTRPPLSKEQIQENAKTYFDQVFKVLDKEKTEVRFNSEWLSKITFEDWFRLCANFTLARILERDDFQKRFSQDIPIFFHELFYPIMQAYDSYAIDADVELGGTDQKFNLIMGRHLLEVKGKPPQIAIILPILRGLDGVQKMSKSLGNYVGITEDPKTMFGKIMSIPDDLISEYYYLVLDVDDEKAKEIEESIKEGKVNPRDLKLELAKGIVEIFHGIDEAQKAYDNFIKVFSKRELPDEMPELHIEEFVEDGVVDIVNLLVSLKILPSKSEVKRLIEQGGLKINDEKIENFKVKVNNGDILRVGKRQFFKLVF